MAKLKWSALCSKIVNLLALYLVLVCIELNEVNEGEIGFKYHMISAQGRPQSIQAIVGSHSVFRFLWFNSLGNFWFSVAHREQGSWLGSTSSGVQSHTSWFGVVMTSPLTFYPPRNIHSAWLTGPQKFLLLAVCQSRWL